MVYIVLQGVCEFHTGSGYISILTCGMSDNDQVCIIPILSRFRLWRRHMRKETEMIIAMIAAAPHAEPVYQSQPQDQHKPLGLHTNNGPQVVTDRVLS